MPSDLLKLPIYGMNCVACATQLETALNALPGITCEVNFALERAQIHFKPFKKGQATEVTP